MPDRLIASKPDFGHLSVIAPLEESCDEMKLEVTIINHPRLATYGYMCQRASRHGVYCAAVAALLLLIATTWFAIKASHSGIIDAKTKDGVVLSWQRMYLLFSIVTPYVSFPSTKQHQLE
jgi:hypothetical protein